MSLPKRIVLVGPMGAGKSTIGRMLARELGYRFLDSDRIIEERCGANIPWIFDVEGEDGFRQRETAMLAELSEHPQTVLATGGGAVMREENHPLLKRDATVVYLKTSIEQQVERTRRDRNRPLLQNDDPETVLRNLFAVRDPIYTELADIVMFTDRKSPRLVVRQLVNRIHPRTPRHKRQVRKEGRNHA
ncbi:shikimate kinase AroK [Marinobacter orientalis]|uniref:Shikimate kinase n=1 Tax=Marinobacter orientalis TaxID=1928859 RepID=A0A7Y0WU07_9GAMM|nr:shikimate kinase AroK [Marinobacter orientalis]NMT65260.1 shikimate kinase AroK [Marinobacter orientalis]TGX47967.1 shikimate kinase AroK [Marinobacter orientalis]